MTTTTIAVVIVFGSALLVHDHYRIAEIDETNRRISSRHESIVVSRFANDQTIMRATGRIEGRTEVIELRSRVTEQIARILVSRGEWVEAGSVLVELDNCIMLNERDLAQALLNLERAKRQRLMNGSRESEIEIARREYESAAANYEGAERSHRRALRLAEEDAISPQSLDDSATLLHTLKAGSAAALGRLNHLRLPARADEVSAADAGVAAAESRLMMANLRLERVQIKAPVAGRVLALNGEIGEIVSPTSAEPLIVMADTRRMRVVAEVDEFDSLRVQLGQLCGIHCDAIEGTVAQGMVTEIEPRMNPKRLFGQWAGERTDTSALRVWIDLQDPPALPIGLPVDVFIHTE